MKSLSSPFELIKKSLNIFFVKENSIYFLKVYMWLIPFQAFFVYQNYFVAAQSKALNTTDSYMVMAKNPWFLTIVIIVNLAFLVASFLVSAAGIAAVQGTVDARPLPVKEVFKYAWKKFWLFTALSIVLGLIELGGVILLIIPGIVFAIWYGFSKFVMIDEGKGIKESLRVSRDLVKGRFWKVFGRVVVFTIFILLVQTLVALVPYGMGSVVSQIFAALYLLPVYLLYRELSA